MKPSDAFTYEERNVAVMSDSARETVWDSWMQNHAAKLLLFARQQTRCEADAQDLMQDAITESWRRFNGKPPPLPSVFATVRRRAIDLSRKENRRSRREEMAAREDGGEWFDSTVEDREMSRLVESALKELASEQREVIVLKLWSGLTFSEIAEALEVPANTAASRYRSGLIQLRKLTREVLA